MNKAPIVGQRSREGDSQIWKVIHSQDCLTNHIEGHWPWKYGVVTECSWASFTPCSPQPQNAQNAGQAVFPGNRQM